MLFFTLVVLGFFIIKTWLYFWNMENFFSLPSCMLFFFPLSYFLSLPGLCWNARGKQSPLFTSHTGPLTHLHHMLLRKTMENKETLHLSENSEIKVACTVRSGNVRLESIQMKDLNSESFAGLFGFALKNFPGYSNYCSSFFTRQYV